MIGNKLRPSIAIRRIHDNNRSCNQNVQKRMLDHRERKQNPLFMNKNREKLQTESSTSRVQIIVEERLIRINKLDFNQDKAGFAK